jgi:hypothetical protein
LDEQRREFFDKEVLDIQGALQIGFRGVHSDAGNSYPNSPFGWLSLKTAVFAAELAGLKFDAETIQTYMGPKDWTAKPTPNAQFPYHGGYQRTFPKDMYLHWSVKWFGKYTKPLNGIRGFNELPDKVWRKW